MTDLHRALLEPAAYPERVAEVGTIETHISRLYFVGSRVYKVKKSIRLPFLDYSTLERRRRCAEEEVRLNRRLAGDTYLGVVAITRDAGGAVRVGGDGDVIEYAVEMKRLPAHLMLDARLERGEVDNELVDRIVDRLVTFHAQASTGHGVDEHATPAAIRALVTGNLRELADAASALEPYEARCFSENRRAHLAGWLDAFFDAHGDLFLRRVAEGRIREGHGDLHAGNVCVLDDRLVIYDCIEFNAAFRCVDVAAELAFFGLDLDLRGFRGFARLLARRYADRAGDPDLIRLIPFYEVHYACVRAKVGLLRARGAAVGSEARRAAVADARRYLDLAARRTLPPILAILCGLPGSGKSTVARVAADAIEATVLRSDVIRKRLAGHAPTDRVAADDEQGLYAPAMSDHVYATMLADASGHLADGRSAVVDAAFASAARRAPFLAEAKRGASPFVCIHVHAPEAVVIERLERRAADPEEPSDADGTVYRNVAARFEPPGELPESNLLDVSSDGPLDDVGHLLIEKVIEAVGGRFPARRSS